MAEHSKTSSDVDPTAAGMMGWCQSFSEIPDHKKKPLNHLRITGLPKDINARTLTSMIVTATMIGPRKVQICSLTEDLNGPKVGLVEYKSPVDCHRAAEKLRNSPCGSRLTVKITTEPEMNQVE